MKKPAGVKAAEECTEEQLRTIAYHEAGHTVAAWFLEHAGKPQRATIIRNEETGTLGDVHLRFSLPARRPDHLDALQFLCVKHEVQGLLAGKLAGNRADVSFDVTFLLGGAERDERCARDLLRRVVSSEPALEKAMAWLTVETEDFLDSHWTYVEALARMLLEHKTLSRTKIREVMHAEKRRRMFEERARVQTRKRTKGDVT